MYGSWTENVVCGEIYYDSFETHKRFYDVQLLSLSSMSTFKIIHLGGYILRLTFLIVTTKVPQLSD